MKSIREKIIQKIRNNEVKKKPRWIFVAKNYFFWVFCILSIIIGAIAFATSIFLIYDYDWDIYTRLRITSIEHILGSLPYLWVIILGIFTWLAYREFKNTKSGYRFMPYAIVGGSIIMSLMLGSGAYALGIGEVVDAVISKNIPPYRAIMRTKSDVWRRPDVGLIAGRVGVEIEEDVFEFIDLDDKRWNINITRMIHRGPIPLSQGTEIRIVGKKIASSTFQVDEIRPWHRNPMMGAWNKQRLPMKDFGPMNRNR